MKNEDPKFLYTLSNCVRGQNYFIHCINVKENYSARFVSVSNCERC